MDDHDDEIARRHRIKPDNFVRPNATSSCATPRHNWRIASWCSQSRDTQSSSSLGTSTDSQDKSNVSEETNFDDNHPDPHTDPSQNGGMQNLCPPLQSLRVSRRDSEKAKESKKNIRKGKHCLEIKLDLGLLEKVSQEPDGPELSDSDNELHQRREKMAECDKQCTRIMTHLFLGGKSVAQNLAILQSCRITHILNCVGFVCSEYFPDDFIYKTLWLQDTPTEDILSIIYDVFDYFEDVREQAGGRVFVHCCQGVSRSAALVIAYLMWREHRGFEEVFEYVKGLRGVVCPNLGFVFQLMQLQSKILDPSKRQPVYLLRMAPHSVHDPLHLVPKSVSSPTADALDSRGAFVVHLPKRLYVWRGRVCDRMMFAAAERAAFQLVRYEHAQGPLISIMESCEPKQLLAALGIRLSSMDGYLGINDACLCPSDCALHNRLKDKFVAAYSSDYDMYRKARSKEFPATSGVTNSLSRREGSWNQFSQEIGWHSK
ncbi:hypothetical protein O6H91_17G024800 [Diphasiastrum complanatum]|uniref:Uncharacterized protein n=1 Tax=Diphasiastrum complanatum TaxID=34168 RepID=A0ACC2B501_DIPCM|nr:hypothetical protein O6H91_Y555800 [Diphasiastrum complanatum]KAJ7524861.1 hypothetical protein O6H91_17G024800 [Diphasiastrum complanatum]